MFHEQAVSSIEGFYERYARFYECLIYLVGHEQRLYRFFRKRNVLHSGVRVFDVGCGSGALIKALSRVAEEKGLCDITYYGIDFSQQMLDRLQSWIAASGKQDITLSKADVRCFSQSLPKELSLFDLIVSSGMLEYIPRTEMKQIFVCLHKLSRPGGRCVFFISRDSWFNRWFLGRIWKAALYTKTELLSLILETGWQLEEIRPFASWGYVVSLSRGDLV